MELEVKYNPDLNSDIDIPRDVYNLLKQLSDCYNEKIHDMQREIDGLVSEREAIRKALKDNNIEGLKLYLL